MTLEDAIKTAEREAKAAENIKYEDVARLYCDDTECIDYHLERCKLYASEQRQLAEWLKDYKSLKETGEPTPAKWIKVRGMNEQCSNCKKYFPLSDFNERPFNINYCPNCGAKMYKE